MGEIEDRMPNCTCSSCLLLWLKELENRIKSIEVRCQMEDKRKMENGEAHPKTKA